MAIFSGENFGQCSPQDQPAGSSPWKRHPGPGRPDEVTRGVPDPPTHSA